MLSQWKRGLHLLKSACYDQHISCSLDKPKLFYIFSSLNNKLSNVVLIKCGSLYHKFSLYSYFWYSQIPRIVFSWFRQPSSQAGSRNCRNSKWSSLTWHLAHSASAFVTNQLIWISLNQGANSTWWGRTRKVWRRTRRKVGANSKGRTR